MLRAEKKRGGDATERNSTGRHSGRGGQGSLLGGGDTEGRKATMEKAGEKHSRQNEQQAQRPRGRKPLSVF